MNVSSTSTDSLDSSQEATSQRQVLHPRVRVVGFSAQRNSPPLRSLSPLPPSSPLTTALAASGAGAKRWGGEGGARPAAASTVAPPAEEDSSLAALLTQRRFSTPVHIPRGHHAKRCVCLRAVWGEWRA